LRTNPTGPSVLAIIDSSGGRTILTSPPAGVLHDGLPALSPDRKILAFTRATDVAVDEVYTMQLGPDLLPKSEPRRLTDEKQRFAGFSFSPDGTSILASLQRGRSIRSLWRIPLEGTEAGIERVAEAGINATYPVVSRRGGRVVYAVGVDDLNLYRKTRDGVTPLSHSSTLDSAPAISPDGKEVAFRSARSGSSEIWIAGIDGANPRRMTFVNGRVTGSPRWSPDGKWIAYDTRLDGNADVWAISADGKSNRRITSLPSNEAVPSWSRDGKFLYYASDQSGSGWEIWKVPAGQEAAAASVARRVTAAGGFRSEESPDGKWLYYSKREPQSGLWRMPAGEGGGVEEEVAPLAQSLLGGWAVTAGGVYLLDLAKPPRIIFRGATSREPIPLRNLPVLWEASIAASPDGNDVIYAQLDSMTSDLYRVDLRR
jgi:Tol biopolymer transport system component